MRTRSVKSGLFLLISTLLLLFSTTLFPDGFIIVKPDPVPHPRPHVHHFALSVKFHRVKVSIEDNIAVTKIDQAFYNPTRRRLEGYYIFPLPEGAVIRNFSMYINGKEMQAELLGSKKARKIYEDIVRRMKDPALLEYAGRRMFRLRIYPIEPRSEKRIKISYTQILEKDGRTVEYIYPLNTEKFSSSLIPDVSIEARLKSGTAMGNIYCPTHKTEILRRSEKEAVVTYEENNSRPDRDFKLYFNLGKKDIYFSLKTFRKPGEEGFFIMNITPGMHIKKNKILSKNIVFVLDVSGSMSGKKLDQAKRALKFCVNSLRKGDSFDIIRFSTEAESLFGGLKAFNRNNRNRAVSFIDDLRAIGGTNIGEALEKAIKDVSHAGKNRTVIFITDGKPTIGVTSEKALISKIKKINIAGMKIFTFGVGNDINTHLLDKLTALTGAYRSYISPDEDIEVKISGFYSKIESPVLVNPKIRMRGNVRIKLMYPKKLPDIFKGSSATIIGRYTGSGVAGIYLQGRILGEKRVFRFNGKFTKSNRENNFIPKLWASRRVGYLLDQVRLNGEDRELKEEIIRIARKYGIVTPYTSYLIVEDEKRAIRRRELTMGDGVLAPTVVPGTEFEKKVAKEKSYFERKSGSGSVRASKEVQSMSNASDYSQVFQGSSRLALRSYGNGKEGSLSNLKDVEGRSFYFTGKYWIDPLIKKSKPRRIEKVKFGSREYFNLLSKYPDLSAYFALGKNVKVIFKEILFVVHE